MPADSSWARMNRSMSLLHHDSSATSGEAGRVSGVSAHQRASSAGDTPHSAPTASMQLHKRMGSVYAESARLLVLNWHCPL